MGGPGDVLTAPGGLFNIRNNSGEIIKAISVFDHLGRTVLSINDVVKDQLDLSRQKQGIYYVKIEMERSIIVKEILIVK